MTASHASRVAVLGGTLALLPCFARDTGLTCAAPTPAAPARTAAALAQLPLRFEANAGQWDPRVRFLARGHGTQVFVTDDAMTVRLPGASAAAVSLALVGARARVPTGEGPLPTRSHYFIGNDPARWRTDVPSFAAVRARGVVPGVDMVWHDGPGGVEYDLLVAAGVDATRLALDVDGAEELRVAADGSLVIETAAGTLVQPPPRVVQGGRDLPTRYRLEGRRRVGFDVEGYDPGRPLLVDPVLVYSTYLGGSNQDEAFGIAVDAAGEAVITGATFSTDFPTKGAVQSANAGGSDVFVAKLDAAGTALVYATYLGGGGNDGGEAVVLDANGNAFVTGYALSSNFPTTTGVVQPAAKGFGDAFVVKLPASGAPLTYSTFVGGTYQDLGYGIAVDGTGEAVITGYTESLNFPLASAFQGAYGGGTQDAFITRLAADASAYVYSSYLGGSALEWGTALAIDGSGNAYATGYTQSTNFPTKTPYQAALAGNEDAYVTQVSPAGALVYSTYLGGTGGDYGYGIAVDASGSAYVAGNGVPTGFPTTANAFQTAAKAETGFVTKFAPGGASLVYSTFLSGSSSDGIYAIALDAQGEAFVTGVAASSDFPLMNPVQSALSGTSDAFLTQLDASGAALLFSTYLGGSGDDFGHACAVDPGGRPYVTGQTSSKNFAVAHALQGNDQGSITVFVSTIGAGDGGVVDAGAFEAGTVDAATSDAATEAAAPDASSGGPGDASTDASSADASAGPDASALDAGVDATTPDAAATSDAGEGVDATSPSSSSGNGGGCGCSTLRSRSAGTDASALGLAVAALVVAGRRRRNR